VSEVVAVVWSHLLEASKAAQAATVIVTALVVSWRWSYPAVIKPVGAWVFAFGRMPATVSDLSRLVTEVHADQQRLNAEVFNGGVHGVAQAIRRLSARQRVMTRHEAWWEADAETGQNLGITPGFTRLTGWAAEDMIGDGWLRLLAALSPEQRASYVAAWENAVETHSFFFYPRQGTIPLCRADGSTFPGRVVAAPTYGAEPGSTIHGVIEAVDPEA
jgi:PAS domain-containing protein